MARDYLTEQGGVYEGDICMTDGTFFDDMRRKEREILAEIDPEALKILDEEDAERERFYAEEEGDART